MNRREALRSLASGCAAGALAAAGVSLAIPVWYDGLSPDEVETVTEAVRLLQRMDEATRTAHVAILRASLTGADPAGEVYAAVGRARGDGLLAAWAFWGPGGTR